MLRYFICISIYVIIANCVLDHGEFSVRVTKHETCKGPKRKNCSESIVTLKKEAFLQFDMHVVTDVTIIKGKITGTMNNVELLRLQMKNVCDHIFFKPLLQGFFNQTEHCGIFKGRYLFTVDIPTIAYKFYGGNFIYGNWTFHASFWNDYCNVQCERIYINMFPRNT